MRLHWFSPLPPAKTGIADYTVRLLPYLQEQFEVVLWTDQATWDSHLASCAEVRCYHPEQMDWVELNRGDMSIYHIGNNHLFHGSMWQVSRRHPGLIVLHDLHLHHFFAGLYREQWADRKAYVDEMHRLYGQEGLRDAEAFWSGQLTIEAMVESYPLTALVTENALGVLIHTEDGLARLQQEAPCPVVYTPLPYAISPLTPASQSTAAPLRTGAAPYRIIVFGYLHANRRLDALLQAFANLPERHCFRLDIYGQLWDSDHVRYQIKVLALQDIVTVHGFVAEADLNKALAAAHLAVNLRYPTMGEASVSQLQLWEHALPTLVTQVGWYARLPEAAVAFVRPEYEMADIRAHLQAFLANPERFTQMGMYGRRILEDQHRPETYVQTIAALAKEAQRFRPYAVTRELAKHVNRIMQMWTNLSGPPLATPFWLQGDGVWRPQEAAQPSVKAVDAGLTAALETIRQAMAEQADRLRHEQTMAYEAIRQAVKARVDQLSQLESLLLRVVPKQPYNREQALGFPLDAGNHDVAFRYLFDFMVVARSLNLRPGAQVLDFAAGSCYVSELLNRLGYITVAFDLDPELLTIGRERFSLDPRCDRDRTRFAVGDGTRLPFADESFDGVICMNALHHMPDYRATLAEMCRVLRPGGRAVFSEPGADHSKHPESIHMMKQYGVLERDVIMSDIAQLAKAVGFRRTVLKPYVSPEFVDLNYDEFDQFKEGGHVSSAYLAPQEVAEYIERNHPLFYLEKAGERSLTSATAPPELLRACIVIQECPNRARKGETIRVVASCENTGKSIWLSQPRPLGGYVTFGVKFLTPAGRVLDDSQGRQYLSQDVSPGDHLKVVSEVSLEGLEVGRYRILFDMVNEQVDWFQHKGSEVAEQWLEIV
jgi:SAM-dependent methyltransferase/glycosyltransferase involved in cell wall biosynthesis